MSTTAVPAIIAMRMRRYKEAFRATGATTPHTAVRPADIGLRQSLIFQKLVRQQVLVATADGRYYLDETRDLAVTRMRRKWIAVLLLVILVVLAAAFLLGRQE